MERKLNNKGVEMEDIDYQRKEIKRSKRKGIKIGIWIGLVIGIVITLIFFIFVAVTGITLYYIGFNPEILETFIGDELCPLTKHEGMEVYDFTPIGDEGAGCFILEEKTETGTIYTTLLTPAGSMIYPADPKSGDIVKSVLFDDKKDRYIIELESKNEGIKKATKETEKPKITMTEEIKKPAITKVGSPPAKKWRTDSLFTKEFTEDEMDGADTN